jgi:hypothetical protein
LQLASGTRRPQHCGAIDHRHRKAQAEMQSPNAIHVNVAVQKPASLLMQPRNANF